MKRGDVTSKAGTVLCELELPDGKIEEIVTRAKGVVQSVSVKTGQTIVVGTTIAQIADDQFATYYRAPDQRPVEVELNSGSQADSL